MCAPHLFHSIPFPYIGLVVSGGHTILYHVFSFHEMIILGSTLDDAVGEAFDKISKVLGLGYPGGPVIDKASLKGDPDFLNLPLSLADKEMDKFNFSYSGLKTAVIYRIKGMELNEQTVCDIAASFQKNAVDMLYRKTKNALKHTGLKTLVVSGGVAANSYLRKKFEEMRTDGIEVFTAPQEYCGDNAAMIAGRAYADFQAGTTGDLKTEVFSRMPYIVKGKRPV